jgi:hypothetical protein
MEMASEYNFKLMNLIMFHRVLHIEILLMKNQLSSSINIISNLLKLIKLNDLFKYKNYIYIMLLYINNL